MTFTAIPAAGAKLRGSTFSALLTERTPVHIQKPSATTRASTVTETADPDLTIALPANSEWTFRAVLYLSGGNAAGDWSGHMEWPSGAGCSYSGYSAANTLASGVVAADMAVGPTTRLDGASPGADIVFGVSTGGTIAIIEGQITVGATPGNLVLFWAQDSSNATGTSVLEGSTLTAWRVS